MSAKGQILIVDDEEDIREVLGDRLEADGYEVLTAANGVEGLQRIRRGKPDVVLLDLHMPQMDGMEVLRHLGAEALDPTVVVITAYGTIEKAVQSMKAGAYDFITKPFDPDHIRVVVRKAVEREQMRRDNALFRRQAHGALPVLSGNSPRMQEALQEARLVADSKVAVLLLGESGTGKEVLARTIHQWSGRQGRPFVAVNCAEIPLDVQSLDSRTQALSLLFGHVRGSFAEADADRDGCFQLAHGSTLFFDEIGILPLPLQSTLLRALQQGEVCRVGERTGRKVDVRFLAATQMDLKRRVEEGSFRQEFYAYLSRQVVSVPSLRERREDIAELARGFLRKYVHKAKREVVGLSREALECLMAYDWPGNVRELENTIERALVLGTGEEIWPEDLPEQVAGAARYPTAGGVAGYHAAVEEAKRRIIQETLEQCGGDQSRTAERLGLQRPYLSHLIQSLRLG